MAPPLHVPYDPSFIYLVGPGVLHFRIFRRYPVCALSITHPWIRVPVYPPLMTNVSSQICLTKPSSYIIYLSPSLNSVPIGKPSITLTVFTLLLRVDDRVSDRASSRSRLQTVFLHRRFSTFPSLSPICHTLWGNFDWVRFDLFFLLSTSFSHVLSVLGHLPRHPYILVPCCFLWSFPVEEE